MTVSFPIYVYTATKSLEEWLNPKLHKERLYEMKKKQDIPTNIGCLGLYLSIPVGKIIFGESGNFLLFLLTFFSLILLYILYHSRKVSEAETVELQSFGGTCHFLPQGIHVLSHKKESEIGCNYHKIKNLLFCYKEFEEKKILIVKWQYEGKDYQYMLKVDKREKELVALLSFLYEEKIPFGEIDERGKKTYLLDLKIEKDAGAEAYQTLIDEIGKE